MVNAALARHYRDNQITSSAPEEIVLMLYDGAIRFLSAAITELAKKNIPEKALLIEKAVNIIDYLHSCLDKEKGMDIARNMDRLYEYILIRLTEANLKNDGEKIGEVVRLLSTIRDAWADICKNGKNSHQMSTVIGHASPYGGMAGDSQEKKRVVVSV